jgi:hypothetical protein
MARRRSVNSPVAEVEAREELLALALERLGGKVQLPARVWLNYLPEADMLTIRLKARHQSTRSEDDLRRGLIFNYEGQKLVSIEVLDLYGTFTKTRAQ